MHGGDRHPAAGTREFLQAAPRHRRQAAGSKTATARQQAGGRQAADLSRQAAGNAAGPGRHRRFAGRQAGTQAPPEKAGR